jgi:hypothetical protein
VDAAARSEAAAACREDGCGLRLILMDGAGGESERGQREGQAMEMEIWGGCKLKGEGFWFRLAFYACLPPQTSTLMPAFIYGDDAVICCL